MFYCCALLLHPELTLVHLTPMIQYGLWLQSPSWAHLFSSSLLLPILPQIWGICHNKWHYYNCSAHQTSSALGEKYDYHQIDIFNCGRSSSDLLGAVPLMARLKDGRDQKHWYGGFFFPLHHAQHTPDSHHHCCRAQWCWQAMFWSPVHELSWSIPHKTQQGSCFPLADFPLPPSPLKPA